MEAVQRNTASVEIFTCYLDNDIQPNVKCLKLALEHTVYNQQLYGNGIVYNCTDGRKQAELQNLFENPFGSTLTAWLLPMLYFPAAPPLWSLKGWN